MSTVTQNTKKEHNSKLSGFKLDFEYNCTYRDEIKKTRQRGK